MDKNLKSAVEIICLLLLYTLESYHPLFLGRKQRANHAARNLLMRFLNLCVIYAVFSAFLALGTYWTFEHSFGLLNWLPGPSWTKTALGFLLYDLYMYLIHRVNHAVPFLWRFHRVHHTDDQVDVTTALRFHFGEQLITAFVFRLGIVPLLGLTLEQMLFYEIFSKPLILFHHSNIALPEPIDRILRALVVSPNMHRVHHSKWLPETNSNYASFFSFWDRLGRSFRWHEDPKTIDYGLPEFTASAWQTIPGMLKTPLAPVRPPSD